MFQTDADRTKTQGTRLTSPHLSFRGQAPVGNSFQTDTAGPTVFIRLSAPVSRLATVPTHVPGIARLVQTSCRKEDKKSASRCERRGAVPKPTRRPLPISSSFECVARSLTA